MKSSLIDKKNSISFKETGKITFTKGNNFGDVNHGMSKIGLLKVYFNVRDAGIDGQQLKFHFCLFSRNLNQKVKIMDS